MKHTLNVRNIYIYIYPTTSNEAQTQFEKISPARYILPTPFLDT